MPDKKLTDNEIKKALECCSKDEINGLNIFTYGDVPMRSLLRYALDLINRLQEENERLDKEVDRLSQVVLYNDGVTEMKVEEAKAEAYKECIEKVKDIDQCAFDGWIEFPEDKLDNLLKELEGEDNVK